MKDIKKKEVTKKKIQPYTIHRYMVIEHVGVVNATSENEALQKMEEADEWVNAYKMADWDDENYPPEVEVGDTFDLQEIDDEDEEGK